MGFSWAFYLAQEALKHCVTLALHQPFFITDFSTVPATSIPFWDDRCGKKFYTVDEMGETFDNFYARINDYNPKDYVHENLSFKSSVNTLLDILK